MRKRKIMLEQIEIFNFESHKHLIVDLADGLNCIVARSNKGKSSLIRALTFVIENRPLGLSFKNWQSNENDVVKVILRFHNGTVIREKSTEIDRYKLIIDEKTKTYDRPNRSIPEAIKSFLDMNYYNIKRQFDPFFLLQYSPGEVGRKFNEIVDLTIIDEVLKSSKEKEKEAKNNYEKYRDEAKNLESKIESMNYVTNLRKRYNALEILYNEHENRTNNLNEVIDIYNFITQSKEKIQKESKLLKYERLVKELIANINSYISRKKELDYIYDIVDHIYESEEIVNYNEILISKEDKIKNLIELCKSYSSRKNIVSEIDKITFEIEQLEAEIKIHNKKIKYEKRIKNLIRLNEDLLNRLSSLEEIEDLYDSIKELENEIALMESNISEYQKEYDKIIKDGGICPVCKTQLTEEQLRKL